MMNNKILGFAAPAKHVRSARYLRGTSALSLVLLCAAAAPAAAQQSKPLQLPEASVEDSAAQQRYKPETAASPKYTAPLLDTPQTITVIPEAVIKDQNLLSLRDILSTVPGITFGAGEGGGGYGDSITLRGFTASTDVTIDGLRDSAQYTRSDPFNIEQVEVVNGANSVYGGSGSIGGGINLVSKTAKEGDFTSLSAGIGTDNYYRATVDANHMVTDTIGVRLNAMGHMNDVPGRDVEDNKRWGLAPSVAFGLTTPTRVTLSYLYQTDNNIPQYGVPYYQSVGGALADVDPSDYFGYRNLDTQEVELNQATIKVEHDFSENFSVRNLTRWQRTTQFVIVNPPQGTICTSAGINPSTGAACTALNTYQPSGPRGGLRDSDNKALINQTDLIMRFDTGGISHNAVVGVVVSNETFHLDNGNVLRNPGGVTPNPTLPVMTLSNPDSVYTGPVNYIQAAAQDGEVDNQAFYVFDTAKVTEQIELNFGMRYERNRGSHTTATYTAGAFNSQGQVFRNSDNMFSYRAGLVYKPIEDASIYVAYGNQKLPSKSSVNGACTAANCNVRPETGESYEIGAKWNLLENRLSTTAAIFRNKRSNYRVASNDPVLPVQQLDGSARVDGIALGVSGQISPEWLVFTNYTYLKSKVLQGVSDFCVTNPTAAGCFVANTPRAGNSLTQVPDHAASLWTTYQLPMGFRVGYGLTYQGKMYLNNGAAPLYQAPSYFVHRAMAGYQINEQLDVQLNVNNLFDKEYYTRIRNNGWATVGDRVSAALTLNYTF